MSTIGIVMAKILTILPAAALLLPLIGCQTVAPGGSQFRNVQTVRLNKQPAIGIMVISDERKGPAWYRTEDKWKIESLTDVPETSCQQSVEELSVSPDDKMLAVISVGEGHPCLDVFELKAILTPGDGDEDMLVKPLRTIDPYPGGIMIVGWRKGELDVVSDVPLDRLDKKERRAPVLEPMPDFKRFLWHIATDTIRPADSGQPAASGAQR